MKGTVPALIAACLLTLAAEAGAQDFTRRQFAFFDRQLAIEVSAVAPGAVHIVRGAPGRLEVRGRSEGGFAGFGLMGNTRDRLQLAPVGAQRAEYLVVVPEHVRVRVRLPEGIVDVATTEPATTLQWGVAPASNGTPGSGLSAYPPASDGLAPYAAAANGGAYAGSHLSPIAAPFTALAGGGRVLAYQVDGAAAPRLLTLLDDAAIGRLDVRVGGEAFAVTATRPLALQPGDHARIELRLGSAPIDVEVSVPAGATLEIRTLAGTLLALSDGRGSTHCQGVTLLRVGGEERYTFANGEGAPLCR